MVAAHREIGVLLVGDIHHFYGNLQDAWRRDRGIRWMEACLDCQGAAERVKTTRPDVLFLYAELPGIAEYDLVTRLRGGPFLPSLVMGCPAATDPYLVLALALGAAACVTAETPPAVLVKTLRMVGNGELPSNHNILGRLELATQVKERLQTVPFPAPGTPSRNPLSRREREVLQVVSQGFSNRDVGQILNIQEQTVKNHVSSILRKTHAQERFQAAAKALRYGWILLTRS